MVYTLINGRNVVKMFKTQMKGSDFTAKLPPSAQKQKKTNCTTITSFPWSVLLLTMITFDQIV